MRDAIKYIGLVLAIPLLVGFHLAQSSYLHYHHLSDGSVVAHSHPYQNGSEGTSNPKHTHTSSELVLLQMFSGNYSSDIDIVIIEDLSIDYNNDIVVHYNSFYSVLKENKLLSRGPPKLI